MDADYQRIVGILEDQLREAVKREDIAAARFGEVRKDIAGGRSYPESAGRVANTAQDYIQALKEVSRVVQRIADFQIHRIVPDGITGQLGALIALGAAALSQ